MNIENEIRQLLAARRRMERQIKELDAKVEHLIFLQKEHRQCLARSCPLEDQADDSNEFWR
jgi:prefoldin subunit 5